MSIHRRHGSIRFSSDLKAQLTLLGDEQGILRAVIGDIQNFYVSRDEEWIGDLLELQSNDGSVSVRYDDEIGKRQGISGFLSRFLNQ